MASSPRRQTTTTTAAATTFLRRRQAMISALMMRVGGTALTAVGLTGMLATTAAYASWNVAMIVRARLIYGRLL